MKRVDAVVVQPIVTEYDEEGRAIAEVVGQPSKVFYKDLAGIAAQVDRINVELAGVRGVSQES